MIELHDLYKLRSRFRVAVVCSRQRAKDSFAVDVRPYEKYFARAAEMEDVRRCE